MITAPHPPVCSKYDGYSDRKCYREYHDLSGQKDAAYENQSQAELGWCMADLYWNEGGTGKILWLDLAPGLVYSLSVENGASEAVLLGMAETLFTPVQDDVG